MVLRKQILGIKDVYVPVKRRQTLDLMKVEASAESMMQKGQDTPILVRPDGQRFVLVEGLHRLEACKALGETTVPAYLVQARSTESRRLPRGSLPGFRRCALDELWTVRGRLYGQAGGARFFIIDASQGRFDYWRQGLADDVRVGAAHVPANRAQQLLVRQRGTPSSS